MNNLGKLIKSKIIRIGNSQGVRIPHMLLQQLRLNSEVEMSVQDDQLIIRAAQRPRAGWEIQFARVAAPEPDVEMAADLSEWDGTEWKW